MTIYLYVGVLEEGDMLIGVRRVVYNKEKSVQAHLCF